MGYLTESFEEFLNENRQRATGPARLFSNIGDVWAKDSIYNHNNLDGTYVYSDIVNLIKYNKENGGDVDELIKSIENALKEAKKIK